MDLAAPDLAILLLHCLSSFGVGNLYGWGLQRVSVRRLKMCG